MKLKNLLLAAFCILGGSALQAQEVSGGDKFLNLGIGFGNALYSGTGNTSSIPPISGSLEVVIKDDLFDGKAALGLGGYLGYSAYKWKYAGYDYGWKYSNVIVGPRGYLHYSLLESLDTYAGVTLGYNIVSSKWYGTGSTIGNASGSGLIFSGFLGARYFFKDNLAALVELGSGIAYLNLGIALKL